MTIYTSEKVMPYVYMCIHRVTGEFYIGSRTSSQQKLPSHLDLPKYKTSSKRVKPRFDEFDWFIIAEFFDTTSAYDTEQLLINDTWDNPLSLNGNCALGKVRWNSALTRKGHPRSEETKRKLSEAKTGIKLPPRTEEYRKAVSERRKNNPTNYKHSAETREKLQAVYDERRGKKQSAETIQKKREARLRYLATKADE